MKMKVKNNEIIEFFRPFKDEERVERALEWLTVAFLDPSSRRNVETFLSLGSEKVESWSCNQ